MAFYQNYIFIFGFPPPPIFYLIQSYMKTKDKYVYTSYVTWVLLKTAYMSNNKQAENWGDGSFTY